MSVVVCECEGLDDDLLEQGYTCYVCYERDAE